MGKKKGMAPPRYDEKFKEGAIRLVTEQGRPSREVASELGICIDTLRSWLKAAEAPSPTRQTGAEPGSQTRPGVGVRDPCSAQTGL